MQWTPRLTARTDRSAQCRTNRTGETPRRGTGRTRSPAETTHPSGAGTADGSTDDSAGGARHQQGRHATKDRQHPASTVPAPWVLASRPGPPGMATRRCRWRAVRPGTAGPPVARLIRRRPGTGGPVGRNTRRRLALPMAASRAYLRLQGEPGGARALVRPGCGLLALFVRHSQHRGARTSGQH